jgi:rhodanese-related sulfurtransferase
MYGLSLERLPERINFEHSDGGAYSVFPASPDIAPPVVSARALKAMLGVGGELALLDVREEGEFAEAHPLFAVPAPLSRLELAIDALVPRRSTRIVIMDDGDGRACRKAALALAHAGYLDVSMLDGGLAAWRAAGFEVFSGVNVPSKAFGEFVEHREETPRLEPAEVKRLIDAGTNMVVLDFAADRRVPRDVDPERDRLPGRRARPPRLRPRARSGHAGGRQLRRADAFDHRRAVADQRRRAQPRPRAQERDDGLASSPGSRWRRARRATRPSRPTPAARARGRRRSASPRRFGVSIIGRATLARFEGEAAARSLFRFDVRTPTEYAAGHLPGFRHAAGGQLVQATDRYVGVRGARIVLACDTGTRSIMTASWLLQMGGRSTSSTMRSTPPTSRPGRSARSCRGWAPRRPSRSTRARSRRSSIAARRCWSTSTPASATAPDTCRARGGRCAVGSTAPGRSCRRRRPSC